MEDILGSSVLEDLATNLIYETPLQENPTSNESLHKESRPVVFFAHGYGGLIYEKVYSEPPASPFTDPLSG